MHVEMSNTTYDGIKSHGTDARCNVNKCKPKVHTPMAYHSVTMVGASFARFASMYCTTIHSARNHWNL